MLRSYFLCLPLPESPTPLEPSQSSTVFMQVYKLLCLFSNVQIVVMPCNFAFLPLDTLLSFPRWDTRRSTSFILAAVWFSIE